VMRSMSNNGILNGSERQHITRMVQIVYSCVHIRPLLEVCLWLFFQKFGESCIGWRFSLTLLTLSEWNGRLV
jgi:hypothetical protein